MKATWLLPGSVGCCVLAVPAYAAQLDSWQFNPDTHVLEFTTTGGVSPRVHVLERPTRVVIDLPQTQWPTGRDIQNIARGAGAPGTGSPV